MTEATVTEAPDERAVTARPVGGNVISAFESMIEAIPDAGEQGIEGVLAIIAGATTADELDAAWRSAGFERYANIPVAVIDVAKLESTFADSPLPWYLVCQCAILATGERFTVTTGAVDVVGQIVRAYHLGALPLRVIPRVKPSKRNPGNTFQYLEMVR